MAIARRDRLKPPSCSLPGTPSRSAFGNNRNMHLFWQQGGNGLAQV